MDETMKNVDEPMPATQPKQEQKQVEQSAQTPFTKLLEQVKAGTLTIAEAERSMQQASANAATALISVARGAVVPSPTKEGPPQWARIPETVRVPQGRQVVYVRFPSTLTAAPQRGVTMPDKGGLWRWCAVWELTDVEETIALRRAQGESDRVIRELTKHMIRIVDGYGADWSGTGGPGSIDLFWTEIGARCRGQLMRIYHQLHVLTQAEQADFFENCVEARIGV